MKMRKLIALGLLPIMLACGGSEEMEDSTDKEQEKEVCTYSYAAASTILTWTAFKLSEKIGVDGTFNEINVTTSESEDMFGVLTAATFEIPVSTISTQDPLRDRKIQNSFFGNLEATDVLSGTINSIDQSSAEVTIDMNGQSVSYEGNVTVEGETITMKMTIDITDFEGQIAMDSLGVVCEAKHTGEDGMSKFWSDVNIAVKTTLTKTCE